MFHTLTLSDPSIFWTVLYPSSPNGIRYIVNTTTKPSGLAKVTTVTPVENNMTTNRVPTGVIDWENHLFGVSGKIMDWRKLKQTKAGFFSRSAQATIF
jgi:hypothetical protein